MLIPVEAVDGTALIEVVRLTGLPAGRDQPYPGAVVAHWTGSDVAAALTLLSLFRRAGVSST
ncbi:hypothetical protein [Streptomyces drozdowiczii]|uniref:Uncharacterized protein n=1 Tax=Streptomyces drozdowiczii TaxID=202862 RepID=A0ABY6PZQ4_9ACTN|nr:hypothetical protein [Streptomyces drozdowiczii]MCX0242065.1 hypothetical protein [Streptomyces drozdowiczii]UZK57840.1 hypothetical protein NEH16_30445 [Streptomyces drozdowiczii]